MQNVIVALPAYNEAGAIGELLDEFKRVFEREKVKFTIIVVNDGSKDKTEEILKLYLQKLPLKIVNHPKNLGLGPAILTGLNESLCLITSDDDIIVNMDADNTHSPEFIISMIRAIERGSDIVIASRYQNGSEEIGVPLLRRIYSRCAKIIFSLFLNLPNVQDYTCGFRAYRAGLIKRAINKFEGNLISRNGFACTDELLVHLATLTSSISEVPFILRYDKKRGKSKLKLLTTIFETFKLLIKGRKELKESRKRNRNSSQK